MINEQRAFELAAQVVAAQGADFVYADSGSGCFNISLPAVRATGFYKGTAIEKPIDGDPRELTGCLIGRILDLAGITHHHKGAYVSYGILSLQRQVGGIVTERALEILANMQGTQDAGNSWGNVLQAALESQAAGDYSHLSDDE